MLTDAKLRAAKPREKPYKISDSNQLYLFVTPAGARLWRMNYSFNAKQKSLSFGPYPSVGLGDARKKRDAAKEFLRDGKDPGSEKRLGAARQLASAQNTFERVARQWFDANKRMWAEHHASDVIRSLERDVFPAIGSLPIAALKPPAVLEVLKAIEDRPAIETAKRVRQRMSAIFVYAVAGGIAEADPASIVKGALKPKPKKRKQPAIVELDLLQEMLSDAETEGARPVTRLALRFLALTAVRPGDLRGARWTEFDSLHPEQPIWRIPAARMKGDIDRKEEVGGDHLVPLSRQAMQVLDAIRPLTGGGPLVFPSARHAHRPMSENAIGYLLNRAGYHGRHVPHGWRAAFSTIMNEWAKVHGRADDREVIDLMLAHVPSNKVEGAYNRAAYMPRRYELAQIWADMLMDDMPTPNTLVDKPCRYQSG